MKRFILTVLLSGVVGQAWGSGLTANYVNYGVVTSPPQVDALSFFNAGDFDISTFTPFTFTNHNNLFGSGYSILPFETQNTLYYTNSASGQMEAVPGFLFDTSTGKTRYSAGLFLNQGEMLGEDSMPAGIYLYSVVGSTTFVPAIAENQPVASQLVVLATNIINTGDMEVGNAGVLRLTGHNVTNINSTLVAGSVNTAGLLSDPLDTTGLDGEEEWTLSGTQDWFLNSPGVYDIFWGVTNTQNLEVDQFNPPTTTAIVTTLRQDFGLGAGLPFNANPEWSVSVYIYTNQATNIYWNVVFVNTNFANTNISAQVGYYPFGGDIQVIETPTTYDGNAFEDIVQFSEPVYDVITQTTVTNGVYLIDDGALLTSMVVSDDAGVTDGYGRPNAFEVTTVTPPQWPTASEFFPGNSTYDPTVIYTGGEFKAKSVPYFVGMYGVQIGRNPASLTGSFSSLLSSNNLFDDIIFSEGFQVNLEDPTNEPGRIEINAGNLDITQARLRAEGMVLLNATNLLGGGTAAEDWGLIDGKIGSTNGSLVVSNIFPTTFQRVRGDIYAWSGTWQNTQTNLAPGGTGASATNQWHYHVLVVDQNLFGSFHSTERNLTLTGKNSIVLQDDLNVINQVLYNTTNLTVAGNENYTQNAQDFGPANTPYLQNLLIETNGVMSADSTLDIGFMQNQGQTGPTGRKYTVNSITNFGVMNSTGPLLQAAIIENDGEILSSNGGSMVLEANNLGLGLALPDSTNYLMADGSIYLSGHTIGASNSVIYTGLTEPGSLILDLDASGQLTDYVPGIPTTNTNSAIINNWNVTDGFVMPVKPATGDLFGTEIHTVATGLQEVQHIWAATNRGPSPAGFVNNAVIGRLVLDRQSSNSVFRFSGAGSGNAMYVDYLELTNYAYTNYRSGIIIDPNFTIYFADCNVDPQKLTSVHGGLVWVTNFVGPNSTQVVPYYNSAAVCLMNAAVANSTELSFWYGIANADLLDATPYLLNEPLNSTPPYDVYPPNPYLDPTKYLDCTAVGGDYYCTNCIDGTNVVASLATNTPSGGSLDFLTVAYNGQGSITPALKQNGLILGNSYTLTATPAKGWVFDSWLLSGLGGNTTSYTNVLTFAFVTNTIVTANFIPSPFPGLMGKYNGLFYQTNAVINPASSGAFSLTMSASGTFSGQLLMGSVSYSFSSFFSGAGEATFVALPVKKSSGAAPLTINLQLDITTLSGQIMGDVTNSEDAWDASLQAYLAPSYTTKSPSPVAGNYTFVLPWADGVTNQEGGGDSYGTATVSKTGALTVVGKLADGTTFSESSAVATNGLSPFYVYAAAGLDEVLGWVTVTNTAATNAIYSTNIGWSKGATGKAIYGGGFVNAFPMWGSAWITPSKAAPPLSLFNPVLLLNDGDLATPLSLSVTQANYLSFTGPNASLSITPSTGAFSGWFEAPGTKVKQTISGVVLTNTGTARGFFLGTDQSGSVLLQGQ